ncbi:MAG: hypothetical protein AB1938_29875 [Myxococcota bacterium]
MAGNGDLIRSMRAGGRGGMAAAQEFLRRVQAGSVSTQELSEVQKVVSSPELRDAFKAVASQLENLLSAGSEAVYRDVDTLLPDTEQLTDARALPERFLADLTLVKGELLEHPGMTRGEKAERLLAFFEAYAARFSQLANGTAQARQPQTGAATPQGLYGAVEVQAQLPPALGEAELKRALEKFDKALTRAGFQELRADDGRTGLEIARQMLQASTPEALRELRPQKLDAPGWKDNAAVEKSLAAEVARERKVQAADVKPVIIPHVKTQGGVAGAAKKDEAEPKGASRRSDKVLGGRMLWNALHLLRGEELDDVQKKDALTQLAVAAGLLLGLIALLVGLLVWM